MPSLTVPYYHVNSFSDAAFLGNPAGVCVLENFLSDSVMQKIAAENRHSQTAFVVGRNDDDFDLRWFSPLLEDSLCGHATLAAAYVLALRNHKKWPVRFHTRSGILTVTRKNDTYEMDFPIWPAHACEDFPDFLLTALGIKKASVMKTPRDFMIIVDTSEQIKAISPDMKSLATLENHSGVIVTAQGTGEFDYVSRYFAPAAGIDEDPVTGSINCSLAPYWGERLGKSSLRAAQLSARSGTMHCTLINGRVRISGTACLYMQGSIHL